MAPAQWGMKICLPGLRKNPASTVKSAYPALMSFFRKKLMSHKELQVQEGSEAESWCH